MLAFLMPADVRRNLIDAPRSRWASYSLRPAPAASQQRLTNHRRLIGCGHSRAPRTPQGCVASVRVEARERTGGCLCGAVRYSVRGDPVHVRRCHCADCRKESGSAFSVYAQWPVEAFEMSGEISSYDGRGFCPRCGSRLLDTADPDDTLIEIRIGSLDDAPFELKPEAEIWVKRRESWIPPVEGAAQHDEN